MPHIEIQCFPGRTDEQKTLCAEKIAEVVADTLGCSTSSVCRSRLRMCRRASGNPVSGTGASFRTRSCCTKSRDIPATMNNSGMIRVIDEWSKTAE